MNLHSERGATLVHVAITILGLMTFSAFSIDYGQFWVARRQAQNAADAGAHAGAVARAYDDTSDNPSTTDGVIYDSVISTVQSQSIWGAVTPASATVVSYNCPPGMVGRCVRVDVHRDGTLGSAQLPTFFLRLAGVLTQPVRATATARVAAANGTSCLRPWIIPDWWDDANHNGILDNGETYTAPGYRDAQIGDYVALHEGVPQEALSPSFYFSMGPDEDSNSNPDYWERIMECRLEGWIGQTVSAVPGRRPNTGRVVQDLIDLDLEAEWDPDTNTVVGGMGMDSPRIVTIAMFDPAWFFADPPTGNFDVVITNLISVFIDSTVENGPDAGLVNGYIMSAAGDYYTNAGQVPGGASFLHDIQLIR